MDMTVQRMLGRPSDLEPSESLCRLDATNIGLTVNQKFRSDYDERYYCTSRTKDRRLRELQVISKVYEVQFARENSQGVPFPWQFLSTIMGANSTCDSEAVQISICRHAANESRSLQVERTLESSAMRDPCAIVARSSSPARPDSSAPGGSPRALPAPLADSAGTGSSGTAAGSAPRSCSPPCGSSGSNTALPRGKQNEDVTVHSCPSNPSCWRRGDRVLLGVPNFTPSAQFLGKI